MTRRPFDATRRNRKIGTEDQGWRKQSKFDIPERWDSMKLYYEELREHTVTHRYVHDQKLTFVVEATQGDHVHACTPDDIAHLLGLLPAECVMGLSSIEGVVLRQATRKQQNLAPVWGRLNYYGEVGPIAGPTIFIESQIPWSRWSRSTKQTLEQQSELLRMQQLVGGSRLEGRHHWFDWGLLQLRRWLLYHTLIHEVGHWVDYLSKVEIPSHNGDGDADDLWERYHQRPRAEREGFAHRFSDEWRDELIRTGMLPFARKYDEEALRKEGIDPAWFRASSPEENEAGPQIQVAHKRRGTPITVPAVRPG